MWDRGFGIRADLGRISELLELLDRPQLTYPTVHVAGTNGKTSTARMISSILAASGLKVGVYTSPHLQSIRERFVLMGVEGDSVRDRLISKAEFAETLEYLLPFFDLVEARRGEQVTFFEATTALVFEWLAHAPVDAAVIEAGMGGRWDATNLVKPSVAVITPISIDHTKFLGSSLGQIASEKAGILKPDATAIVGRQEPEALSVIEAEARNAGIEARVMGRDFDAAINDPAVGGRMVEVSTPMAVYSDIFVPLHGAHQGSNLAIAVAAAEQFAGGPLDVEVVQAGAASATSPGRLEVVRRDPLVLLDGAHNAGGAESLANAIKGTFAGLVPRIVLSISRDKDASSMLRHLTAVARRFVITSYSQPRAMPARELARMPELRGLEVEVIEELPKAVDFAVANAQSGDLVLVTGSLYCVGEAREHLLGPLD